MPFGDFRDDATALLGGADFSTSFCKQEAPHDATIMIEPRVIHDARGFSTASRDFDATTRQYDAMMMRDTTPRKSLSHYGIARDRPAGAGSMTRAIFLMPKYTRHFTHFFLARSHMR